MTMTLPYDGLWRSEELGKLLVKRLHQNQPKCSSIFNVTRRCVSYSLTIRVFDRFIARDVTIVLQAILEWPLSTRPS